ncbi:phosphatidylserine/phosphatidylglycerophosphate/cardiolipin synthase family protein [Methyloversatilis sp.]|uniref:phospholipase D-like domain-containing protein n=1 Tax=Methyloversatilis sp. TaxID=2569862 RepID=UPI00273387CB|nr:phospholipase D-like domain-containing protein [Methyloversatilis sp.]MDP2870622.1 phospholipase D-like domain-containing protein [Methyloversatilis sp.]MDP3287738.1 phospholipase D-like domain-containing protein [Methyloversatilis sp.]MDP3456026.1 phospholipase D-like domain-containing protein [Methyloversatilis sp.]MDP3579760.1 phospholipase D-like domain-containing protein [Methyloversatilis sp.]
MPRWIPAAIVVASLSGIAGLLIANFVGGETKIERRIERLYTLDDPRFMQELGVLLGPPFVQGTKVRALLNGDEIFPPMLAAIRGARVSITFETYIYWSGDIGRAFADALAERARRGVKVHVLLDWVGSAKMDDSLITMMEQAGVQVRRFHPPHWSHLGRLNNRTHRKLLVIDGAVGYTGGVGIAPQWTGRAQDPEHWRDTHFEVEGPVVAQMQSVFIDNWIKVTGDVLHGPDYFPALAPAGPASAQMFSSSPSGGSESMQLMYLLAITAASRSIDLSAAYFVPDALTLQALTEALKRGVRLRIVVPGEHIDSDTVRSASRATWGPLLRAGATIAEYAPTMYHCKLMIVDGLLTSVGSTNFDNRSFRLNDEATLNIVDRPFANAQTAAFEADLALARPVTYAQWEARPVRERVGEWLASVIGTQL